MSSRLIRRAIALSAVFGIPVGLVAVTNTAASASDRRATTVYTLSNETSGNRVLAYSAAADGSLTPAGSYSTGGLGTGGGLGSQGALVVTDDHRHLLAVNAGSDSVSELAVARDGSLRLVGTAPSGGHKPISVTVQDETAFVLNGDDSTISGIRVDGGLTPIAGSTRHLSGTGGAQVSFTPRGDQLVVTEKASNLIDVLRVDDDGNVSDATATPSTGVTPFGFAFDRRNHLLVSNAAGGAPGASSVTSYRVKRSGTANVLDGPVATNQSAACWVVVTADGRFAYTTNTASGTISGYRVALDGSLALLDASGVTATVGKGPIDAAIVRGDLYTVNSGSHTITVDHIGNDGSLTAGATLTGLPTSAVGLATI
jgi:6-phosphogluconolactonase